MKFESYTHTADNGDTSVIEAHRVVKGEEPEPVTTTGGTVVPVPGDVIVNTGTQYLDVIPGGVFDTLGYDEDAPASRPEPGSPEHFVSRAELDEALNLLRTELSAEYVHVTDDTEG